MTLEQIEAFLTVTTLGNISAAANSLYVTQSTLSSRIHSLEAELNVPLFIRSRGKQKVELTNYGNAFIPLASQWMALWKNTQHLTSIADYTSLTVASIDSVNNYTFVPFFESLLSSHPQIKLIIHTFHSNEIHGLVQNRSADIGFVFSRAHYPDVISVPVYRELMYLVCLKDSPYHDMISCQELHPEQEVFLRWGMDYQQWHERHWSPDRYPLITVNTGSTLQRYLNQPERWAIAPMSVIRQMRHDERITYYTLQDAPPPRICYELMNRYPTLGQASAIEAFNSALKQFIDEDESICSFESWMLSDV